LEEIVEQPHPMFDIIPEKVRYSDVKAKLGEGREVRKENTRDLRVTSNQVHPRKATQGVPARWLNV